MTFEHCTVEFQEGTIKYAVEILEDQDSPLKLDTVWGDKKEAIKRGVEVYAMVNRCMRLFPLLKKESSLTLNFFNRQG